MRNDRSRTRVGVSLIEDAYQIQVAAPGKVLVSIKALPRDLGYTRAHAEAYAFGVIEGLRLAGRKPEGGVYHW